MALPRYSIVCTRKKLIATKTFELAFTKPEHWTFKSGQFILVDVPLIENPTDIQPRAHSIASSPTESELLLVIKLKDGGRASRWIDHVLKEGDSITIQGPFGNFVLPPTEERPLLFISTGAGIAPFRAMMREALAAKPDRKIDCIFGVRTEDELFWVDDLTSLAQQHASFTSHVSLSRPHDAWTGHRGRVQTIVPHVAPDITDRAIYVCGNPDMTKDVKKLALETWNVPKQQLHVEGFI